MVHQYHFSGNCGAWLLALALAALPAQASAWLHDPLPPGHSRASHEPASAIRFTPTQLELPAAVESHRGQSLRPGERRSDASADPLAVAATPGLAGQPSWRVATGDWLSYDFAGGVLDAVPPPGDGSFTPPPPGSNRPPTLASTVAADVAAVPEPASLLLLASGLLMLGGLSRRLS